MLPEHHKLAPVRLLLRLPAGADPNSPALLRECAKRGKLSMLTELLDRGEAAPSSFYSIP